MIVKLDKVDRTIIEYKGCRFFADVPNYTHIFSIHEDYPLSLLRHCDVVLDLGSNIGAFSLPASKRCSRVIALEPVFVESLRENIKLNSISNIDVIDAGIGKGGRLLFSFMRNRRVSDTMPFSALRCRYPEVSVVKLDIEGDEWLIDPALFEGVRLVMGEVHLVKGSRWKEWNNWFLQNGYRVLVEGSNLGLEFRFVACLS